MPILWRTLIADFIKITCACTAAFVAILLTMRLDEIAHFATMGAPLHSLLVFIVNQIPYILPIALPLSSLISAFILMQRLSSSRMLSALRSCGISLSTILAPLLLVAAFLSLGNFLVTSELATHSHLSNNLMKSEMRAVNPLLLLNNKHLMRMKGYHFESLGSSRVGESASNIVLAIPSTHQHRIHLLVAEKLQVTPSLFNGEGITIITSAEGESEEDFDNLLIENVEHSSTQVADLRDMLHKKITTLHGDHLQLNLLFAKLKGLRQAGLKDKAAREEYYQGVSEILRRISIAIAVFSCTLLGAAMGISIARRKKRVPLAITIGLTTLYLIAFFMAKSQGAHVEKAALFYFLPHLIIIGAAITAIRRIERGIE